MAGVEDGHPAPNAFKLLVFPQHKLLAAESGQMKVRFDISLLFR